MLIEYNLTDVAQGIYEEKAADVKDITDHPHRPIVLQRRGCLSQPVLEPNDHIVSQTSQKHDHLLRLKAFLAALGEPQALFVAFERGLHTPTTLV